MTTSKPSWIDRKKHMMLDSGTSVRVSDTGNFHISSNCMRDGYDLSQDTVLSKGHILKLLDFVDKHGGDDGEGGIYDLIEKKRATQDDGAAKDNAAYTMFDIDGKGQVLIVNYGGGKRREVLIPANVIRELIDEIKAKLDENDKRKAVTDIPSDQLADYLYGVIRNAHDFTFERRMLEDPAMLMCVEKCQYGGFTITIEYPHSTAIWAGCKISIHDGKGDIVRATSIDDALHLKQRWARAHGEAVAGVKVSNEDEDVAA